MISVNVVVLAGELARVAGDDDEVVAHLVLDGGLRVPVRLRDRAARRAAERLAAAGGGSAMVRGRLISVRRRLDHGATIQEVRVHGHEFKALGVEA